MGRRPQSHGTCEYFGEETTRSGMLKHLAKCDKRAQTIRAAEMGREAEENLWYVRVQDHYAKEFWLDLEMRGTETLETLDSYLRAIWLECCGHLSKFTAGGWHGYDVSKSRKADDVFTKETTLLPLYDFGTASETEIQVIGSRAGRAVTRHPIALMARNRMPEMPCQECGRPAAFLCLECLYQADDEFGNWYLCAEHVQEHPHEECREPLALVNSPRLGVCGYEGPADSPY